MLTLECFRGVGAAAFGSRPNLLVGEGLPGAAANADSAIIVHDSSLDRRFETDEVAALVRATGAKITMEPKDVTIATTNAHAPVPIRIFFCEGPNGEIIEFFQNSLT